ncbi:hypothetical protein MYK68_00180 [Gordonia sp. PP30]|uniref:hypothetical protein n=1 Tax=Gordonia sp. PP30 TaxID=2935861 RepID=UPI001FFF4C21|nr:hypothetical protein [Gordonia sp. PP30]UQE75106.1 hypothetical protein MYK68_00180 [Gordonia sp. PP30]
MIPLEADPVETALTTILAAAIRVDETIVAAPHGCLCPILHLGAFTTRRDIYEWSRVLRPFANDLPDDLLDPILVSLWLERALLALDLRPGVGRFPAIHSHTPLPASAVAAIRERPGDDALRSRIAHDHDVLPLDCLAAALPDGPGWAPVDDRHDFDGPCGTCGP